MTRRGIALLALIMGACAGEKDSGVAGRGSAGTGSNGVASSGTGGDWWSGVSTAAGTGPTGGNGSASSAGGASAGGGTGGASSSGGGVADASGASGHGQGGGGPSGGSGALSTGSSAAGGSSSRGTAGTGGLSNNDSEGIAGGEDVVPSTGGRGGPKAGSGGDPDGGQGGSSDSAQGGASRSAPAGAAGEAPRGLSWPIDCLPEDTCVGLGAPDIDGDGIAYDCRPAPYAGHEGTDIAISWEQMDAGVAVRAAADGEVFFAADGKYDRCPNATEPDCQRPAQDLPGDRTGTNVCTEYGPYCGTGTGSCFWCFAGGNVVVILHEGVSGVFATRYDHLRKGSVLVSPGDRVARGQMIAEVGSAGASTGPHLHFEVWGTGYYELADPWAGVCGPNLGPSLWTNAPPWQ
jgi:murein DD-endopeptidase MepM/ murein hydrolase activator NlpD